MTALWSGNRFRCARVRGELTEYAGQTCIMQHHPVLGETYFAVDPETLILEVYHADKRNENIRGQQLEESPAQGDRQCSP